MAVTISVPNTAGFAVGPGFVVESTGWTGPTALDDIVVVRLVTDSGGAAPAGSDVVQAITLMRGFTTISSIVGVYEIRTFIAPAFEASTLLVQGQPIVAQASRYNAAHSFIESSSSVSGLLWDAINGMWSLVANSGSGGGGGIDAELAAILAAVQRTYP